jgi:hypothetical protein
MTIPALALVAIFAASAAQARTCHYYAYGEDTAVRACDDGSFTVIDPRGRVRVYHIKPTSTG